MSLLDKLEERDRLDDAAGKGTEIFDRDLEFARRFFEDGAKSASSLLEAGLDDEEEEKSKGKLCKKLPEKDAAREEIFRKSPEDLFKEVDADGSGLIEFDEFKDLLPKLGIHLTEAKAKRYFDTVDSDGSGALEVEEFKAALYACDPENGNSIGFTPNNNLNPKDAFLLFDEDNSGQISEDEFADVLEYLDIHVSEEKREKMFKKYDTDGSGFIEYSEFRKIWLQLSDLRGELRRRGVTYSKHVPKAVLMRRLEELIDEEERQEEKALAQAKLWKEWQFDQQEKQEAIEKARRRAEQELMSALDVAGQVYAFGVGAHGQFAADGRRPSAAFKGFETVQNLWNSRVMPEGVVELKAPNAGQPNLNLKKRTQFPIRLQSDGTKVELDEDNFYNPETVNDLPGRDELQYESQFSTPSKKTKPTFQKQFLDKIIRGNDFAIPDDFEDEGQVMISNEDTEEEEPVFNKAFKDRVCSPNAAALWGRRVIKVSAGLNIAFALTDSGELLAWGGRDRWWTEVSKIQKKSFPGELTQRSKLLLNMAHEKKPWPDEDEVQQDLEESEYDIFERLKFVTDDYFRVYEQAPNANFRMKHFENVVVPRISFERITLSLSMRGFKTNGLNKRQMLDVLSEAIQLEHKFAGKTMSAKFRSTEEEILSLRKRKRGQLAGALEGAVKSIWRPLLKKHQELVENREKEKAELRERQEKDQETKYAEWRLEVSERENAEEDLQLRVVTERGEAPRPFSAAFTGYHDIAAGAFHVAGITALSKQVYSWGDGNFGRLGQGQGPKMRSRAQVPKNAEKSGLAAIESTKAARIASAARFDVDFPTLVQDLSNVEALQISCGFAHSAVVSTRGKVFIWGGANNGALGLGPIKENQECYCPYPIRLRFPEKVKIQQISCGNAHTGAVTTEGLLFMWGCGDGGRLGLGREVSGSVFCPELVRSLQVAGVFVQQVSCGCTHSALCTRSQAITEVEGLSKVKKTIGGNIFVAGPSAAIGRSYSRFHPLKEFSEIPISQVSCGYSATACVSVDGELFSWGVNRNGAIGHTLKEKFIHRPRRVHALYQSPQNLALGKQSRQSSVYSNHGPEKANNGDIRGSGENYCIHTQYDAQPFWEVDLGRMCIIEKIILWNREDDPLDAGAPRDQFRRRLFPCWILVAAGEMDDQLLNAHAQCAAKKKFTSDTRRSIWNLPTNTAARFVRVQLEGANYLHFAELEVRGTPGLVQPVGRVSSICLGKEVMFATVSPINSDKDIENAYARAVKADPANALILRQFPTFFKSWDKIKFGENISKCPLCRGSIRCEICVLKNSWYISCSPGPNGRLRRLDSIAHFLLNTEPPPLNWEDVRPKGEGMVANMLKTFDNVMTFFNKTGGKLVARHLARDRFGITLHEADMNNTDYLLSQLERIRDDDQSV